MGGTGGNIVNLEKLLAVSLSAFKRRYDTPTTPGPAEDLKFFCSDKFDEVVRETSENLRGEPGRLVLANAGGSDAVLSLYGALLRTAPEDKPPALVVADRKPRNLDNFIFRYFLTKFSETRHDYLKLLFGFEGKLSRDAPWETLLSASYDAKKHLEQLARSAKALPSAEKKLFLDIATRTTKNMHYAKDDFVKGIKDAIERNPQTHYLAEDSSYRPLHQAIRTVPNLVHAVRADIGSHKGVGMLRKMLKDQGLNSDERPISAAFLPGMRKGMDATIPFLSEEVEQVVYAIYHEGKTERMLTSSPASRLANQLPDQQGLQKYREMQEKRVSLEKISKDVQSPLAGKGMPLTAFMTNIVFGSAYSDQRMLDHCADLVHEAGVETVVLSEGIAGPFFFTENARRQQLDMRQNSLDAQLRAFTNFRKKLGAKVVYVMGRSDEKVIEDLTRLYVKAWTEEHGKKLAKEKGYIGTMRLELNSGFDNARTIIANHLYPYLLRLGNDALGFFSESGSEENILEAVDTIGRKLKGKKRRNKDNTLIDPDYLADSKDFIVTHEWSGKVGDTAVRAFPNTRFSRVTQYASPFEGLHEISKLKANGTLAKQIPESILVDMGASAGMLKLHGRDLLVWPPGMVDDKRALDNAFLDGLSKRTLSDPTHKRRTIAKRINTPGSWIVQGDPEEWLYVKPIFPFVRDQMEAVQKSGKGKRRFSMLVTHDHQLGSLTELPEMMVNLYDYAMMERKCIAVVINGDLIQGRNYRRMPIENAMLGAVGIGVQQRGLLNLLRPYVTLPQLEKLVVTHGNHEWNSDRDENGHEFHISLETAVQWHAQSQGREVQTAFPMWIVNEEGSTVEVPYYALDCNGYGVAAMHTFSEKGAGKGTGKFPSSHPASWRREMGVLARPQIYSQAHYHETEIRESDNSIHMVLGCTATISGFEHRRQFPIGSPTGGILHFYEDGSFGIEVITERFLKGYKAQHPDVSKIGVSAFVDQAFQVPLYHLPGSPDKPNPLHRREYVSVPPMTIGK